MKKSQTDRWKGSQHWGTQATLSEAAFGLHMLTGPSTIAMGLMGTIRNYSGINFKRKPRRVRSNAHSEESHTWLPDQASSGHLPRLALKVRANSSKIF